MFEPKRQWKRYDPEPNPDREPEGCPDCSWKEWETKVWLYTIVIGAILLLNIIFDGMQR